MNLTRIYLQFFFGKNIHTQIRIKGQIYITSKKLSDQHYKNRSREKNALSYISNQSQKIKSYRSIISKYKNALEKKDSLDIRPDYWGGYSFILIILNFGKAMNLESIKEKLI